MVGERDRPATDEVSVSQEMISAGLSAYLSCRHAYAERELVEAVYIAMERARSSERS
jgi:hypothetical protein